MENRFVLNSRDTRENINFKHRVSYKEFKKSILERDNYTCKYCGVGKYNMLNCPRIDVHHIKPTKQFPELRLEPSNCITLCSGCHKRADNHISNGKYTKEYDDEDILNPSLLEELISS